MALARFGFIVTGAGLDPANHRVSMSSGVFVMIAVGVTKPEQAIAVARALVTEGVQLIELCVGFGPLWTAKVIEAIDHSVPVGSVLAGQPPRPPSRPALRRNPPRARRGRRTTTH